MSPSSVREDVAAASAALLFNLLPELMLLDDSQRYDRLRLFFADGLAAYEEAKREWRLNPVPSIN